MEIRQSFCSKTKRWKKLKSGHVYGNPINGRLRRSCIFDCNLRTLYAFENDLNFPGVGVVKDWSFVRDHVHVLEGGTSTYELSEFALEISTSRWRKVNDNITMYVLNDYKEKH